jgi:hypothetical protein
MHESGVNCTTPGACESQNCPFKPDCDKEFWRTLIEEGIQVEGNQEYLYPATITFYRSGSSRPILEINEIGEIDGDQGNFPPRLLKILKDRNAAEWVVKIRAQYIGNRVFAALAM